VTGTSTCTPTCMTPRECRAVRQPPRGLVPGQPRRGGNRAVQAASLEPGPAGNRPPAREPVRDEHPTPRGRSHFPDRLHAVEGIAPEARAYRQHVRCHSARSGREASTTWRATTNKGRPARAPEKHGLRGCLMWCCGELRHHYRLWMSICRSDWFLTDCGNWSPRCCRRSAPVRRAAGPRRVTSGPCSRRSCTC
jgi:hypothetical protein